MSLSFIENEALVHLQGQGRLSVGRHSYGRPELLWWGEDVRLEIGSFCSIADGVTFMLGGNHRVDWVTTYPFSVLPGWDEAQGIPGHPATKGDIVVGSDVWIGNGALILSGVRIGHGAVIGARSLVAKDVPPYAIVGGNPARVIRNRFTPGTVGKLLEAAWWEWDEARIRRHMPLLLSGDVEAFLSAAGHPVGRDDPPRLRAKAGRILRQLIKGARNPLR